MRFERKLALRYLKAQKRHSILTICSIVAALILMTALFTAFSTVNEIEYRYAYSQGPYHLLILNPTREETDEIANAKCVDQAIYSEDADECSSYQFVMDSQMAYEDNGERAEAPKVTSICRIFLDKGFDDPLENGFLEIHEIAQEKVMDTNSNLLYCDHVGMKAKFHLAQRFALFSVLVLVVAFALRLIIDTAFEVSSREREKQFGILQSIGATPKQIVRIITHEGMMLSVIGVPIGMLLGCGVSYLVYLLIRRTGIGILYFDITGANTIFCFRIKPLYLLCTAVVGTAWVFFSAYGTGMRIVKMSAMDAIHGKNHKVRKPRRHRIMGFLFGWVGSLAAKNVRRMPKRFFITVLTLTVSMMLFAGLRIYSAARDAAPKNTVEYEWDQHVRHDFCAALSCSKTDDKLNPLLYVNGQKQLMDSGYFNNVQPQVHMVCLTDEMYPIAVLYLTEESYLQQFNGEPPVPYQTLLDHNSYILATAMNIESDSTLPCRFINYYELDKEEFDALSEEEKADFEYASFSTYDSASESFITKEHYNQKEEISVDFPIEARHQLSDSETPNGPSISLIGTLQQYEQHDYQYARKDSKSVYCFDVDMADPSQYEEVKAYLTQISIKYGLLDNYVVKLAEHSENDAVVILMNAILVMISLTAIVNMINIISTGLLNRKSEFASLQSIGMTPRQFRRLAITEALQYVLTAAFFTIVLSGVILTLIKQLFIKLSLEELSQFILFKELLIALLPVFAGAFIIALIATLIPLTIMQKESIVGNIRSID